MSLLDDDFFQPSLVFGSVREERLFLGLRAVAAELAALLRDIMTYTDSSFDVFDWDLRSREVLARYDSLLRGDDDELEQGVARGASCHGDNDE